MNITDIRDGIAANVGTISGLRTAAEIPDNISPPIAVVSLNIVQYDTAFGAGLNSLQFAVSVIVARVDERRAQERLNDYISTGASSVKAAIESDKTLGGAAIDCRVTEMTNIGSAIIGEVTYVAMDVIVTVYSE